MNAIEYFKKNGLLKSKMHLDIMNAENWHNEFYGDLKQIVDAFELVKSYGGLIEAIKYSQSTYRRLSQPHTHYALLSAIELVEKCQ